MYIDNKLYPHERMNPRLRGILGSIASVTLLCLLVGLCFVDVNSLAVGKLQGNIVAASTSGTSSKAAAPVGSSATTDTSASDASTSDDSDTGPATTDTTAPVDPTIGSMQDAAEQGVQAPIDGSPLIIRVLPPVAKAGDNIIIRGRNFSENYDENYVTIGDQAVPVQSVITENSTPTGLKVQVPTGLTGDTAITVRVNDLSQTLDKAVFVGVKPQAKTTKAGTGTKGSSVDTGLPTITQFLPQMGKVGAQVYLYGQHFAPVDKDNMIYFRASGGMMQARDVKSVYRGTDKVLSFTVPVTAVTGPITLQIGTTQIETEQDFTVQPDVDPAPPPAPPAQPVISAVSSTTIAPGESLLISGQYLAGDDRSLHSTTVTLAGEQLTVANVAKDASGNDMILVNVPDDARSGYLAITMQGQTAVYDKQITVDVSQNPLKSGAPPEIHLDQTKTVPVAVTTHTSSIAVYTYVTDPNGADDIATVTVDLSDIGGTPGIRMLEGEIQGKGRVYGIVNFPLPAALAAGTYQIPITATVRSGQSAYETMTLCVDSCDATTPATSPAAGNYNSAPAATIVPPPVGVQAAPDAGYILIQWTAPSGVAPLGYYVYYGTQPNALVHRLATRDTSAGLSDIVPGTTYYFAVTTVLPTAAESAPSPVVAATALTPAQVQQMLQAPVAAPTPSAAAPSYGAASQAQSGIVGVTYPTGWQR